MKCPECKYDFLNTQEDYVICPNCANLVEENMPNNISKSNLYAKALLYKKRKNKIEKVQSALLYSCLAVLILIAAIMFSYERTIFPYSRIGTQYRMVMQLTPLLAFGICYFFTNPLLSKTGKYWKDTLSEHIYIERMIKVIIYIVICIILLKTSFSSFQSDMLSETKRHSVSVQTVSSAIKTFSAMNTIMIIYAFIVVMILEILDIYKEKVSKEFNSDD